MCTSKLKDRGPVDKHLVERRPIYQNKWDNYVKNRIACSVNKIDPDTIQFCLLAYEIVQTEIYLPHRLFQFFVSSK